MLVTGLLYARAWSKPVHEREQRSRSPHTRSLGRVKFSRASAHFNSLHPKVTLSTPRPLSPHLSTFTSNHIVIPTADTSTTRW